MNESQSHMTPQNKLEQRVRALEKQFETLATKKDVEEIVRETMKDVLFTTGRGTKAVIITLAVVIGSLAVIGGGLKWILGFIGFSYMTK